MKNHYVRPNFAYPSELYAIAGTNVFHPDSFTFDIYWSFGSLEENEEVFLPSNAMVTPLNYGSVLSLPSECDKKTGQSRFGVFLCQFQGSGIVDPLEIPVIITPTSGDHISFFLFTFVFMSSISFILSSSFFIEEIKADHNRPINMFGYQGNTMNAVCPKTRVPPTSLAIVLVRFNPLKTLIAYSGFITSRCDDQHCF